MRNITLLFILLCSFTYKQSESVPSLTKLQGLWKYNFNSASGIDSTFEMYKLIKNDTMVLILNDKSYLKPTIQFSIIGFQDIDNKPKNISELKSSGNNFCSINFPADVDNFGNIKRVSSPSWLTINENGIDESESDYLNFYIKAIPETYTRINKLPQDLIVKLKKNNQLVQISKFL